MEVRSSILPTAVGSLPLTAKARARAAIHRLAQQGRLEVPSAEPEQPQSTRKAAWLVYNLAPDTVQPLLQDGPMCGMVAATMAAQCVAAAARTSRLLPPQAGRRVDADSWQLLQMARDKQWTQQGEMFVASQLAQLTAENFQADAKVVEQWGILQALQLLSAGQPLLVPYDAAPNHEPCLQGGQKAHWATICGFVVPASCATSVCGEQDADLPWLHYLSSKDASSVVHTLSQDHGQALSNVLSQSWALAMHGKSRHLACWAWRDLLDSSNNLYCHQKDSSKAFDYIVPASLDDCLRGRLIAIFRSSAS